MSSGQYEKVAQGNISLHLEASLVIYFVCLTHSRNNQSYTLQ